MSAYYTLVLAVIALFLGSVLVSGTSIARSTYDKYANVAITLSVLLLFAARAPSVGGDVYGYMVKFQAGSELGNQKMDLEVGYALLNDFVRSTTSNGQVFLAVVAALTVLPIGWVIQASSKSVYLSWVLFIAIGPFSLMLSGLRQGIALSLVFATLPFLARRRVFIPLLLTLLAGLFHTSALLFIPAILLYRVRITPRSAPLIIFGGAVLWMFSDRIFSFIVSAVYDSYSVIQTGAYRWALVNGVLLLLLMACYRAVSKALPQYVGLYTLVLVGVSLMFFSALGTNVMRGAMYYQQFFVLLIPNALSTVEDKRLGSLASGTIGLLVLAYFFAGAPTSSYLIYPYQFFWV